MKILILSQYAGSQKHGMVIRNYNWAIALKELGHDVTVMASGYSHYRQNNPVLGNNDIQRNIIDGIRYLWVRGAKYNPDSNLGRIKAMAEFTRRSYAIARRTKIDYDLVIASSPQPFVIYAAKKIAKKAKAKLIYDIRDLWPLTLIKLGNISKFHPFIMALQHAENYACKHADMVTGVPQNAGDYLKTKGLKDGKFLHVGNGFLQTKTPIIADLPETHETLLQGLEKQKAFMIGYTGTIGKANAMHIAVRALKNTDKKIHLVFVGRGNLEQEMRDLAVQEDIQDRVHFLPPIAHEQVHHFLSRVDAAYVGALRSELYEWGASPTKINDYMMAKKPIIYTVGDKNNPVELAGSGISCQAENVPDISAAYTTLAKTTKKKRLEMGTLGYQWLLDNQIVSGQIDTLLEKLKTL